MSESNFDTNRTINGTYGEAWIDDEYVGEAESLKAQLKLTYSSVSRPRKLMDGKKLTKVEGSGSVKLHHVRSTFEKKILEYVKAGKTPDLKIISKLADPDAYGAERVALYHCKPDTATLADWENGKLGEESFNFSFEEYEYLQLIEV